MADIDQTKYVPTTKKDLEVFRSGIYLHYKGHLYSATNLSTASSRDDLLEIAYVSLQLEGASEGPRHHTREFFSFLLDRVHVDGTRCDHLTNIRQKLDILVNGRIWACPETISAIPRYRYLGPVYERWMLDELPWPDLPADYPYTWLDID